MAYNFLRDARKVRNSELCSHDNLDGYSSDFHENGNVDGWDIYNNIYLYGCWNGILFGTAYDRNCYVSRTNIFPIVEAEDYYYIKIMMKITNNSPNASVETLTTGRIQWIVLGDSNWTSDKQMDFEITADDKWRLYVVNMGPAQNWQGNITNLRVYPFLDGRPEDQFSIKFIKISSLDKYACDNTNCSYHPQYSHPCPGAGIRGSCEAGVGKDSYTTVSGVSDTLVVNINEYGSERFSLGNNSNVSGKEMAKIVANKISSLNIGGYAYAFCEHDDFDKLKITSGSTGEDSSVVVSGDAAEALGFYEDDEDISVKTEGTEPATGFDYASSRILTAMEINRLIDGNSEDFAYIHNPSQYSVEGGRRDFNEIGTAELLSSLTTQDYYGDYYDTLNNEGRTLIDFSHPFNNNGRITAIYMYGVVDTLSKIKVLRPRRDGSLKVIHSLNLPLENDAYIYTTNPTVYRVDCNILVEKGDLLGIYNANLYVGVSPLGQPEAIFIQVTGDVSGTFTPQEPLSFGVGGFAIYARGDRWQTNTIFDIDLGDRINIEEINIYGREESEYFDFNVACCEDVSWEVDLFGEVHHHSGINWVNGAPFYHTHQNIAYGLDCLDDCIKTADNGQVGTSYGKDSNGVWTSGDNHSYFYVNGDAEWLYHWDCSIGKHEYCGNLVPRGTSGFIYDPIAFTLKFPYEFELDVHKSIIYFKEKNNFRGLALSYYLGQYSSLGNADDSKFQYIPEYTRIRLDGIIYDPDDDEVSNPYIFSNPMSAKPIYAGAEVNPVNWEVVQAAHGTDWTIIEHNFDPVTCKGFRIYTNHHHSTKITEMEVYSRVATSPSLLDNVTLSFSDYGDIWTSVSFEEVDDEHINAFIGGAPRYFTLEFDSATEFSLNEIDMLVGDQVKLADCSDVVMIDHAKSEAINEATPITIENIYDKPFDLYIDLPKEVTETDEIVFYSKLGSYDEIYEPEIGPGCKLHKQGDYPIRNYNGQCAINVPAYGLKNLVHNKEAYYTLNDVDYVYWGTISSGVSLDFCNNEYKDIHKSELSFTSGSSKYWKLAINNASKIGLVKDIIVYYGGNRVPIETVYTASTPGASSQLYGFSSDGVNISELIGVTDDFDDDDYTGVWTMGGTAGSTLVESGGEICVGSFGSGGTQIGPEMTTTLDNSMTDFYLYAEWRIDYDPIAASNMFDYGISFRDSSGTQIIKVSIGDHSAYITNKYLYVSNKAGTVLTGFNLQVNITEGETIPIEILRVGSIIKVIVGGVDWSGNIDTDVITDLRILYQRNSGYGVDPTEFCTEYVSMTSPPMIGNGTAFGFALQNSAPLDTISLRHSDCSITSATLYTSPDNGNNYIPVSDLESEAAWNENDKADALILSNGNLTVGGGGAGWHAVRSVVSKSSGKWYWEITIDSGDRYFIIGVGTSSETLTYPGDTTEGYGYYGYNGRKYHSSYASYGDTYEAGDVVGVALDLDNGKIWWSKNGVWQASGDPAAGTNEAYSGLSGGFYAMVGIYYSGSRKVTANFGKTSFQYTVPTGFNGLYSPPPANPIFLDVDNETTYTKLAVDLEDRHDVDIVRNYGDSGGLKWVSTSVYTDFSNTNVSDVDNVIWANSDKDDVRWLRINLINDSALNCIRKLGIYPDISSVFCRDGGYNCEWHPLGNILSDYTSSINVAYGATTTGTNYYYADYYPDNAVDGSSIDYRAQACWGYQQVDGIDPYLELDFGQLYLIDKVVLYHGYDPEDLDFLNTDYTFEVSTTTTGSFTTVFSISGNTKFERTHQFDPVYARRARLTITGYDSEKQYFEFNEETGQYETFEGCYLREIEVYNYVDTGYIDSETWPVVCVDLQDQFNIIGHGVINKDVTDTDTNWNNSEEFFMYSDNIFDDPQKVSFTQEGDYRIDYQKTETFTADVGTTEYMFSTVSEVYLYEGLYYVEWDARADNDLYNAAHPSDGKISLRMQGPATVDHFADIDAASTWLHELGTVNIPIAGFYTIKAVQHIDATYGWGARNPIIYRSVGLRKWAAAKRDTAENYSYDNDPSKRGADYLSLLKVYGDEKYNPTEYYWWWDSVLSTLDGDHLKVKTGSKSLKISYPAASGVDTISFLEGDDFGMDDFFESKDALHFWWYIDNVNKLDTNYGDITFGVLNSSDPAYYSWNISELSLSTGWNNIQLKFEDADSFYPVIENYYALSDYFDEKLDFRNNDKDLTSFRLRYRGKGQAFTMNIDDLKIERNVFADDVKFGKGLCLTGYDYLEIPLSTITLEKGTIEFWTKLYTDTYGRNIYGDFNSRVLFTLVNNNNDIISLGIKSGVWFEPTSGHIRKALNAFDILSTDLPLLAFYDINEVIHLAMTWSNDGSFMDNGNTVRFYINNTLICSSNATWEVEDTKSAILKLGGATTQMALNKDAYGAAIFDNVKIHNYCKTEFDINREGADKDIIYTPNEFLEVSSDNVNFYGIGSANLPLIYPAIPAGDSRIVYVRSNKNENFAQSKKTATLIIDWLTTV